MNTSVFKMTFRSVKASMGRFIALFLIVALSAGFFAGLKLTKSDMHQTLDTYFEEQQMYDFYLLSTLGFTEENVDAFKKLEGIADAEGSKSAEALLGFEGNSLPYKLMSLTNSLNKISLSFGRLPENSGECIADANVFSESDIGKTISVSPDNADKALSSFNKSEYTIVGIAESPLYLGLDRGSTSLPGGKPKGFIYLLPESFTSEAYTEVYIKLKDYAFVYSDEYEELIDSYKANITKACREQADIRYKKLLSDNNLTEETASYAGIEKPNTYVLTRSENAGYASFENDTSIVSGIANVFPLFFILVAMLVCITTMSRMVSEERTQIGILKAIGFSNASIIGKYLLYAGSATVLGWIFGYFLGTMGIPQIFWLVYNSLYDFAPLEYKFNPWIVFGTLLASLAGTLGSTFYSCRRTLYSEPAKLIRPKAPKAGKRIIFEHIKFIWNKLPFLQKVSIRNMFLSKKRFLMMIIGISGCTALLVTGFGVRDSLLPTGEIQYEQIHLYDIKAELSGSREDMENAVKADNVESYVICGEQKMDILYENSRQTAMLMSFDNENLDNFFTFRNDGNTVDFPKKGEIILSLQAAQKLEVSVGDTLTLQDSDRNTATVTLSGIFDNHINNYAIISAETYSECFGGWEPSTALINAKSDSYALADELLENSSITGITIQRDRKALIDDSLACLNYIIFLIIFFAGALAFVVIYNLTNINIAERSREIATVKVLGFYPKETNAYILRENLILSAFAGIIGLPLGVLLHRFVLHMIDIDGLVFPVHIAPFSYIIAFILTILFAFLVNLYMRHQVDKIHMAESLKTVE